MPFWEPRKPKPRALTAAGQRVVPKTAATIGARRAGDWQKLAWNYRQTVPELRYVGGFVATQLSRVRWFVAEAGPEGYEPRPLTGEPTEDGDTESAISVATQKLAIDALERLDLNSRGSSMAGRGAENFEYAGECYLLGEQNPETGIEEWTIRSVSEVRISKDAQLCPACGQRHPTVRLVEPNTPATNQDAGRVVLYCQAELFRLWNPDPEYHDWADAKITACLGVLEEIVIYDRQARAAARSRIASGALLYVPEELSLSRPGSAPVDTTAAGVDDDDDLFMSELVASMLTPISSDEDPSAIVPLVVRGPAIGPEGQPYKDLIGAISIPREDVKDAVQKREAAVIKLAHGLDVPPEILTGLGSVNHWSAYTISDAMVKGSIEPRAENFADSLTASYLRDTLKAQGVGPDELARVCVWFDASELAQPADPMTTAAKLHEADVLSDEAYARAGGYGDADLADETEKLYRALSKGRIAPQAVPILVALASANSDDPALKEAANIAEQMTVATTALPGQTADRRLIDYGNAGPTPSPAVAAKTPAALAQAQGGIPATAQGETPTSPRVSVTAAATPRKPSYFRVDETLCRELADVDSRLVAELGGFIDAAILDIVRQAANRIRSGAMRASASPEEKARFPKDCDPVAIVAAAGDVPWTVSDQMALEGALDRIKPRWLSAIRTAARKVLELLTRLVGRAPSQDVVTEFMRRAEEAWPALSQAIEATAIHRLHGHDSDDDDDGPVLPRSVLTEALTVVGDPPEEATVHSDGTVTTRPATGLAAGKTVQDVVKDAGGANLGYLWRYESVQRTPFPPHKALSGERFAGFNDPKLLTPPKYAFVGPYLHPGDHRGCGCSVELLAAIPRDTIETAADPSPTVVPDAGFDEVDTPEQARIRELAEADDRAGRRGTLPDGRTYAQRDRDLIDELRRLRRQHVTDRTVKGQAIRT